MDRYSLSKKVLFIAILIILPVGIIVIFGEFYFRYLSNTGYITPEILKTRTLQYKPALFCRHVLEKEQNVTVENIEYYINEKGYRGHDFSVNKPKETIRIIIYGGSAVFDPGSSRGKDWPHQSEERIKQSGFPKVEVINAGIPGHASFDSLGRLFARDYIFTPDYVVLCNAWNDIKYFQGDKPLLKRYKPYDDKADPRLNYQNWLDEVLCNISQVYVRLRVKYLDRKLGVGLEGKTPIGKFASEVDEAGLKQYQLNMEMFVDLARNVGAIPILMTQPRLVTKNNTDEQKARINYQYQLLTHQALSMAFEKTDEIIYEVAEEKNVPVIDASNSLSGRDDLFGDHVHLTSKGSEEVSNFVADWFIHYLKRGKPHQPIKQEWIYDQKVTEPNKNQRLD